MKIRLSATAVLSGSLLAMLFVPLWSLAGDLPEFRLVIKDHRFQPAELALPAQTKVRLVVENQDATPEEFESHELNREKIVPGNSAVQIFIGPLDPGEYPFFGEFNPATAQGKLVVK